MIYDEIDHASHKHKLKLACYKTPYMCDGCKQMGFGSRYRCDACNYDLHRDCAFAARRISHPFFKNCDFHLFTKGAPPGHGDESDEARICHACGSDVQGFFYHCMECKRELHPGCASLPRSIGSDDVRLELRPKVSSKCDRCGWKERRKQLRSWSYVSTCGGYCFHVSCVKEAILERWEKVRFGNVDHDDDDDNEGDEDGESSRSTALALENTASGLGSGLQLVVRNNGGSGGKLGRYWRILKMALKFVISVIVGDPTGIVGGLITSLFSP